jgi:hypothetical protein
VHEYQYENEKNTVQQQKQFTRPLDDIKRPLYSQANSNPTNLQPSYQPAAAAHDDIASHGSFGKPSEKILKLQELNMLLKKYCPPETARGFLIYASQDDKFLDETLTLFSNGDRIRSAGFS